jgi:hypothetical protein
MAEDAVTRFERRMREFFGFVFQTAMAGETKLPAALRELELLRTGMRVVARGAIAVFDWTVHASFGKFCLLFGVAVVTEIGALQRQELGKLGRVRIVATFASAHLYGSVHTALREFLLQLRVALVTKLGSFGFERNGGARAACRHE